MLPLFSIAGGGDFSESLSSASASFLSLADICLLAWTWAICAFVAASKPTYFLVVGSKPESTSVMLATASSCAITFGLGGALGGSFWVIASMSFCAPSTPSICLSVSAICFTGGGAGWAGAIWFGGACLVCPNARTTEKRGNP